jgi:uncharacterized glyoxalase superfamily protein PhnB
MKPAITSPVMRQLGVADADRSVAFYRDVLGFDVRLLQAERDGRPHIEVVSGPARIELGAWDYPPSDWKHRNRPGSAIAFFETDDIEAMHAAVRARGGTPSELTTVNGIKMRMFEIRDPDGHALWFGQSFDQPHALRDGRPMCETIMPELPLNDVAAGVSHYRDVLGFTVNYAQHDIAVMDRDRVRLLLIARTHGHSGIGSAYVYVADADALHAELRAKGANVEGEPVSQPWGLREFRVIDLEGNRLTFGQPFE